MQPKWLTRTYWFTNSAHFVTFPWPINSGMFVIAAVMYNNKLCARCCINRRFSWYGQLVKSTKHLLCDRYSCISIHLSISPLQWKWNAEQCTGHWKSWDALCGCAEEQMTTDCSQSFSVVKRHRTHVFITNIACTQLVLVAYSTAGPENDRWCVDRNVVRNITVESQIPSSSWIPINGGLASICFHIQQFHYMRISKYSMQNVAHLNACVIRNGKYKNIHEFWTFSESGHTNQVSAFFLSTSAYWSLVKEYMLCKLCAHEVFGQLNELGTLIKMKSQPSVRLVSASTATPEKSISPMKQVGEPEDINYLFNISWCSDVHSCPPTCWPVSWFVLLQTCTQSHGHDHADHHEKVWASMTPARAPYIYPFSA